MLRVRVIWTGPSSPLISTFNFNPATEDLTAANASGDAVANFMNSVRAVVADDFSYTVSRQVDRVDLTNTKVGVFNGHVFGSSIGQDAGDLLPTQTQGLINWHTGSFIGGREIKGRTFIPGPTESNSSAGLPLAAYTTALANAAAALIADAASSFAIFSLRYNSITTVDTGVAAPQWKVLRERR